MAAEVMMNNYSFLPSRDEDEVHKEINAAASEVGGPILYDLTPKFAHNEGHDIESLWWVAIYLLYFNGDAAPVHEETPDQGSKRKEWMLKIFPSAITSYRSFFLTNGPDFLEGTSWFPRSFAGLVRHLGLLREYLVICYKKFERRFPLIDKMAFDNLHNDAIVTFQACTRVATGIQVQSYKVLGRKRQKALSQQEPPVAPPVVASPDPRIPSPNAPATAPGKRRVVKDAPRAVE